MLQEVQKTPKIRQIEFDIIKGLAIFLVLCGHSLMSLSSAERWGNNFFVFINSFHMPLFMLISGFFSSNSLELPFKELITKKFWQLIYPTITFGLLFLIADIIFWDNLTNEKVTGFVYGFWFLKSCFLCFVILFLCLKLFKGNILWGTIFAFIISQGLPFFKLTYMLPFFIMGYLLARNKTLLYKKTLFQFLIYSSLFGIVFLWYKKSGLNEFPLMEVKNAIFSGNMGVLENFATFQIVRFILGITGAMMVVSLIVLITKKFHLTSDPLLFSVYGKYTLGIYILQTFLLEDLMSRYIDLRNMNLLLFNFVIVPLMSLLIMDICYNILKKIEKSGLNKILIQGFKKERDEKHSKLQTL